MLFLKVALIAKANLLTTLKINIVYCNKYNIDALLSLYCIKNYFFS